MTKFIEFHAVYDSQLTSVSEFRPVRILVAVASIETVMENPIEPGSDDWPKGCRVTLIPGVAEYGEGDEVAQGQRVIMVKESYEHIATVLSEERGIVRIPAELT